MNEESDITLNIKQRYMSQQYYICEIHGEVTEIWCMREAIWCGQCWGELMDKYCQRVTKGEYK